ncbi:hypothetical protein [Mangrovimonas spongiae]|uniref:Uncharacterized protein n=1 Tax=Mangrovimonas spongiae TaxID=2494697 RepID=A0A3R9M9K3_9FLAO|nr:hypothetical protein [Mangrovimonas spongiae]RSK40502.1 hypothetical protein EJA19_05870 [Mangrovimonas spongiae]
MAKYKSLFKVEGSLDDVNFYKTEDGYRMRTKGGVSKDRIKSDPAFQRTRENNNEFGASASSGKLLRRAIIDMVSNAKDSKLASRLTQVMSQVKNADLTSPRGKRNVAVGIQTPEGKLPLKGFDFNRKSSLSEVLLSDWTLNTTTGEVIIDDMIPDQKLNIPDGATHVEFSCGFLNLDFETEAKDMQLSNIENLPINGTASTVTLTPVAPATGSGQAFYLLKVAFFQEVNNMQYPLKNGTFNALQILEVL